MTQPMKEYILNSQSTELSQRDPVTRRNFRPGDHVAVCQLGHVTLRESWEYMGGICPLCVSDTKQEIRKSSRNREPQSSQRPSFAPIGIAGIVGFAVLGIIAILLITSQLNQAPEDTNTVAERTVIVTESIVSTVVITQAPKVVTATRPPATLVSQQKPQETNELPPDSAKVRNIRFCDRPCDSSGARELSVFPSDTKDIYFSFDYANFERGTSYTRSWSNKGQIWVIYNCVWQGPSNGTFSKQLFDHEVGLRAGKWVFNLEWDGNLLITASADIDGSNELWDPIGTNSACPDW